MSNMWDYADEDRLVAKQHPEWFVAEPPTPEELAEEARQNELAEAAYQAEAWSWEFEAGLERAFALVAAFCPLCGKALPEAEALGEFDPSVGVDWRGFANTCPQHGPFFLDTYMGTVEWEVCS